jgi:ADP-ribose pyrophosphatase YjhB (NUDIX family)
MNTYCLNCEKTGHIIKKCDKPTTSYGVICININNKFNINNQNIDTLFYNKFIDIYDYNYNNLSNITLLNNYYDDIKILMIRRKYSLTYIEFIRGKYNIDDINELKKLFKLMSYSENIDIKTKSFDRLWKNLWIDSNNKLFKKEFLNSQAKFNIIKNANFYNLLDIQNLSIYKEPEWGFPKGRKEANEQYIDCAIREFKEETDIDNIHILNRVNYIDENYIGSNNVNYRNIYYLAHNDNINNLYNSDHTFEVGDMRWMTIKECLDIIRPYDNIKKCIINTIYFFVINLINSIKIE